MRVCAMSLHVERWQSEGLVVYHLHRRAPVTEEDHRAELPIVHDPGDQLERAGSVTPWVER